MRIGIDARMYNSNGTGISRYVRELVNHITKFDTENTYVVFLSAEMFEKFQAPSHVEKVRVDSPYYSLSEQTKFLQALYQARLDLVHFTHFNAPIFYLDPCVVTVHDLTLSKFPGQKMNTWLHKKAYELTIWSVVKKAKHIITVSDHTQKDLHDIFSTPSNKMTTVYLGVDGFEPLSKTENEKTKKKFSISKPCFLYVGVWRNHKNLLHLIDAFNVLRAGGLDAQLLMTGKESPYYPEIREMISDSPFSEDIITPGFVSEEDLHALYSATEVLVNPSFYEGFGIPPLEAMASGSVVAVSQATSHPEICGDAALYFNPHSVSHMATIMKQAMTDESLRSELKKKGLERVKMFRWDKTAQETLAIYNQVLKKGK